MAGAQENVKFDAPREKPQGERKACIRVPFIGEEENLYYDADEMSIKVAPARTRGTSYDEEDTKQRALRGQPPSVFAFMVDTCNGCNMSCDYCQWLNTPSLMREPKGGKVDVQVVSKAVRRYGDKSTASDTPLTRWGDPNMVGRASFSSLEPLLAIRELEALTGPETFQGMNRPKEQRRGLWKVRPSWVFTLFTNGTLLTERACRLIQRHFCQVQVSLDGPKDIHNTHRHLDWLPQGTPDAGLTAWDYTMAGLRRLRRYITKGVVLTAHYTPDCLHLVDRLSWLNTCCDRGLAVHCELTPVFMPLEALDLKPSLSSISFTSAQQVRDLLYPQVREAVRWGYRERIQQGLPFRWSELARMVERLVARRLAWKRPSPVNCYVSIGTDGTIYPHAHVSTPIGHVDRGFDMEAARPFLKYSLLQYRECRTCWCRYLCSGGCPEDGFMFGGDADRPYPIFCMIQRVLAGAAIWLVKRMKPEETPLVSSDWNWRETRTVGGRYTLAE
jgi:radical SAM protein with 4Fe4S-binding SPASM domain